MQEPFKETTVKKLTELELNKMSEDQLQEKCIFSIYNKDC